VYQVLQRRGIFFLPEKRYDMFLVALIFNECSDKDERGAAVALKKLC
jgi:hypothetical protein